MSPTRIVVVDDHEILRKGIVQLLEGTGEYAVVGEAATAQAAHEVIRATRPDLVIADLVLQHGPDGIQLTKGLKAWDPHLPVLLLSAHDESLFAERALEAGASGYVMKDEAVDRLLEAIAAALEGRVWLSEEMWLRFTGSAAVETAEFSDDARRVLDQMGRGNWTTHGLARKLSMSWSDIERHKAELLEALGLRSDIELVLHAQRQRA